MAFFVAQLVFVSAVAEDPCDTSDARLLLHQQTICSSLSDGSCSGNVTAQGDWPNQAIYMHDLLDALVLPDTCLNTTRASEIVAWLNVTDTAKSPWWYTWLVFQVQYYDMPHRAGARVETAATLGRKCWAFAYLRQIWAPIRSFLNTTIHRAGLDLQNFIASWDGAVPTTMELCDRQMANCFVNASYDPALRNGTCPDRIGQFFVGFQWENGGGGRGPLPESVAYPFPAYTQTSTFRADATFAIETTLNYII